MSMNSRVAPPPRNVVAGFLTTIPFIAIIIVWLLVKDRLPTDLPVQWSANGSVTSTQPTLVVLIGTAIVALCVAIYGVITGFGSEATRASFVIPGIFSGVAAAIWIITALINATSQGSGGAQLGWTFLAIPAAGFGLIPYAVSEVRSVSLTIPDTKPLDIKPSETAIWTGTAVSWPLGFVSFAVTALLVVTAFQFRDNVLIFATSILIAIVGIFVALTCWIRVTVDRQGLRITSLIAGIRLRYFPLSKIEQAEVGLINPGSWGGWGYRLLPGRSAIILHGGEGITLTLNRGRQFAVTIDDSETAVALLRSLHGRPAVD